MDFLNQFPLTLGVIYLIVEGLKVYLPHRNKKLGREERSKDEVTDAVFKMYGLAKDDLESDKAEIRELNSALKRANLEINILERKLAALMRVMDSLIKASPEAHSAYIGAMDKYAEEMALIRATYKSKHEEL